MSHSFFDFLNKAFLLVCILATITFTSYCIHQYIQNEDVSVVSFEEYYKNEDDIYPAVTLCFSHYLRENAVLKDLLRTINLETQGESTKKEKGQMPKNKKDDLSFHNPKVSFDDRQNGKDTKNQHFDDEKWANKDNNKKDGKGEDQNKYVWPILHDDASRQDDEQGKDGDRASKYSQMNPSTQLKKVQDKMESRLTDNSYYYSKHLKKVDVTKNKDGRDQDSKIAMNEERLDNTAQKQNDHDVLLGVKANSKEKTDDKVATKLVAEKNQTKSNSKKKVLEKSSKMISLFDLYRTFLSGKSMPDDKKAGTSNSQMRNEAIKAITDKFAITDHNDLIFNITDYLLLAIVKTDGGSIYESYKIYDNHGASKKSDWIPKHYPIGSFGTLPFQQCWTFEIPKMEDESKIKQFRLIFNGSIFQNPQQPGIRPNNYGFEVKLSYPNQVWKSRINQNQWKERDWELDQNGGRQQHYTMRFDIQNVMALKRRNKHGKKCIDDWKNYDEWKFRTDIETLGCRPPSYIGFNTTLPKCANAKNLSKAFNMTTTKNDINPCQMVEKVIFSYDEMDGIPNSDKFLEETDEDNENMFQLFFRFQGDTYMKVTQTKAYDLQNLVGNAGGYMGLFLGVALIQLPPLLFSTVFSAYKTFLMK